MDKINNLTLQKFQENFSFIEKSILESQMYKDAMDMYKEFTFTDDQKAQFLSQVFLGAFNTAVQTALQIDTIEIQTRHEQNKSALEILGLKKEIITKANITKESFYKVQASKMQSAQLQAQALQDKIKAEVLHKSANDNAQINKANCMVSYQNVLSNTTRPQMLKDLNMQQTTVDALNAIGSAKISDYTKEWEKVKIPDLELSFDTNFVDIYASKQIVSVNEEITFGVVSNVIPHSIDWNINGEHFNHSDHLIYSFKEAGKYLVKLQADIRDSETNEVQSYSKQIDIIVKGDINETNAID